MKFLLRLLFTLLIATPGTPALAGPYDGAWSCSQTSSVPGVSASYLIAFVTRTDNQSAYGIVQTADNATIWGYGIGAVSGSVFSGTTNQGGRVTATLTTNSAVGTLQVWTGTSFVTANLSCFRIW